MSGRTLTGEASWEELGLSLISEVWEGREEVASRAARRFLQICVESNVGGLVVAGERGG